MEQKEKRAQSVRRNWNRMYCEENIRDVASAALSTLRSTKSCSGEELLLFRRNATSGVPVSHLVVTWC